MLTSSRFAVALAPAFLVALVACDTSDAAGRQPLAASPSAAADNSTGASGPALPLAAMNALDAGNTAYRAKQFDVAIAKYREAAVAAPTHAAPWFGVFMAANELKNTALADSAMAQVKALSSDPAALGAHAEVTASTAAPAGGALPPGHPTTQPQLPPGHPTAQPQLPPGHPAPVAPGASVKAADSTRRSTRM
jgi:hypothetical protein